VPPVMRELLKIMANLMSNDEPGLGERGYRAITKLSSAIPEPAWELLFRDSTD
jgi:hypothetical protein